MESKAVGCVFVFLVFVALSPEPQAAFNAVNQGETRSGPKRSLQVEKGFVVSSKLVELYLLQL